MVPTITYFYTCEAQTARQYFDAALVKFNQKDYRGAIDLYTKSLELNPKMGATYASRALVKRRIND